ncbi:hypothetical protein [Microbulbifer sp. TYP-18]|uniref:hypothetical protein n=1 Tax=Microbulbifer sp. TYP-18 TaxID=3230024 RepID=UPI0034C6B0DC
MTVNALDQCIADLRSYWTGLNSDAISRCRTAVARLAGAASTEPWLAQLHEKKPAAEELYRDPDQGFILLAHVEYQGQYRKPHNHGNGWVFYGLQHGEVQMATYGQFGKPGGGEKLVSRGAYTMRVGDCSAFLPGDIHDTRCLSDYMLMFRLTSCDFAEEKRAGRLQQFELS